MAEVMVVHASTPERIRRFNKVVSELKIPFEGKIRKGYAPVFPYKVEFWVYKTKEECMPAFLEFIKSNTSGAGDASARPMQGMIGMVGMGLKWLSWLRHQWEKTYQTMRGRRHLIGANALEVPDMSKVKQFAPMVEGWGHSAVIAIIKDNKNSKGHEEL